MKAQNYTLDIKSTIINFRQAFSLFLRKLIVMNSMISEGVQVSVETFYQPDYSNPMQSEFMFAYRITLENHNSFPVKLHRRHWYIFDSNGSNREVEGEGVVGVQPTITTRRKLSICQRMQSSH